MKRLPTASCSNEQEFAATAPAARAHSAKEHTENIQRRNRAIGARYYYWRELRRRRTDDIRQQLCENEFFIKRRTLANCLVEQHDYIRSLKTRRMNCKELSKLYPGFNWDSDPEYQLPQIPRL